MPGTPADRMQFIDVRDLGAFLIKAIEDKRIGTYNAVGPTDATLGAVLASMQAVGPETTRLRFVPTDWLAQNQAEGWDAFPLAVAAAAPDSGFARVSAARAIAAGLRFRSAGETAKATLAWWNTLPAARRAQKRPGLCPEREAELLARWHARESER